MKNYKIPLKSPPCGIGSVAVENVQAGRNGTKRTVDFG